MEEIVTPQDTLNIQEREWILHGDSAVTGDYCPVYSERISASKLLLNSRRRQCDK